MRNATLATLLLVPVLALAACGGDDNGEDEAEQAAAETTTTTETSETVAETPEPAGALLVIMDASGSMNKELGGGGTRLEAAKDALRELVASLPEGQEVGLRVFGNDPPKGEGCEDTELVSPVAPLDPEAFDAAVVELEAKGGTPIGRSLEAAGEDLPSEGERTIVLVSDGKDSCAPPDPCDVAAGLEGAGIDVRIETVGFALGGDQGARQQLKCIAEAGGGSFHDVSDAEGLSETLGEAANEVRGACKVPPGTGGDWDGEWDTTDGRMSISQSGDEVNGCYYSGDGQIVGTVSGDTLEGTWDQPGSGGRFRFRLSEDGTSWKGTYDSEEDNRYAYGEYGLDRWDGTRLGDRAP